MTYTPSTVAVHVVENTDEGCGSTGEINDLGITNHPAQYLENGGIRAWIIQKDNTSLAEIAPAITTKIPAGAELLALIMTSKIQLQYTYDSRYGSIWCHGRSPDQFEYDPREDVVLPHRYCFGMEAKTVVLPEMPPPKSLDGRLKPITSAAQNHPLIRNRDHYSGSKHNNELELTPQQFYAILADSCLYVGI